jgi:Cdc6-like AAA superfamily ATPase
MNVVEKNTNTILPGVVAVNEESQNSSELSTSISSKKIKEQNLITNLDFSIANFSDCNLFLNNNKNISGDGDGENYIPIIEESILKRFAPPGLETQFKQLYTIIFPSLYRAPTHDTANNTSNAHLSSLSSSSSISSSSAAILMGAKGSGKSLLLDRVLAACQEQQQQFFNCSNSGDDPGASAGETAVPLYRMVTINGIVCRGQDVSAVVYEIIRQLSEIAYQSTSNNNNINNNKNNNDNDQIQQQQRRRRKRQKMDKHMLRLRKSAFTSNLALLESTLEIADADGIPILLVLDELDSFTEEGERQMLLYHFLDRVATPGSNLILVGITSSFSALTLLEKRIRSRAEGTAKIIYLRTPPTYQGLLNILEYKLKNCIVGKDIIKRLSHYPKYGIETNNNKGDGGSGGDGDGGTKETSTVEQQKNSNRKNDEDDNNDNTTTEEDIKISVAMEREFRLGKDLRWFSRVIAATLSLYRHDCLMAMPTQRHDDEIGRHTSETAAAAASSEEGDLIVLNNFHTKYIRNAMIMMGASVFDSVAASRQPDLCIVDGVATSPRLQALLDLSTPQVALLLCVKRILTREEHRDQAVAAPLTMERILKEYESFRRGSTSSVGNAKLLKRAAYHLMEHGLLVPSMDHSGGGPMQYCVTKMYRNLDNYRILRLPLQVPLEIDRELGKALELNLLECPTALKEWGKSIK